MPLDLGGLAGQLIGGAVQVGMAKYAQPTMVSAPAGGAGVSPSQIQWPTYGAPQTQFAMGPAAAMGAGALLGEAIEYIYDAGGNIIGAKKKKKRRRRRRLASMSDIKDLSSLKGVLGNGEAFKVWIATHSH